MLALFFCLFLLLLFFVYIVGLSLYGAYLLENLFGLYELTILELNDTKIVDSYVISYGPYEIRATSQKEVISILKNTIKAGIGFFEKNAILKDSLFNIEFLKLYSFYVNL